ncbi:chloramphenicol resistance protein [Phycomyces blakesleeanus]
MVHTLIPDREGSFTSTAKHKRSSSRISTKSSITAAASIHSIEQNPTKEHFQEVPLPYSSFSKKRKMSIVAMAALSSFFSPFSANIYFPALNMIQQDMHTTTDLINLTVTVYMVFQGVSPSFWGGLADNWGRRPVYIMTIFIYIMACIGIALAPDYKTLLGMRMLQAFGSSSVIAIGAGTIGDVAVPAERAGYMGMYSMGTMMGPILGPVLGGILSHQLSWRWIFWLLAILSSALWITLVLFLPETLRKLVGDGSGYANPTPFQWYKNYKAKRVHTRFLSVDSAMTAVAHHDKHEVVAKPTKSRFLTLPNPLQSVLYLLEKDVAVVLMYNSLQYAGFYSVLTSMTHLFTDIYHLNELQIGLCFLANGLGAGTGSFTAGRILNWQFKKIANELGLDESQTRRGNMDPSFPIERARMSITWIWGIAFNIAMIIYGWLLHIKAPIAPILFLQAILGYCSTSTFNATSTLLVDLFPRNSSAIVASNNLARCLLGAVAVVIINPGIAAIGVGWMFTTVSLVLFVSRILMVIELRYGHQWRLERTRRIARKEAMDADQR